MSQAQPYTAAYTVNETGFGVIESTQQQVTYSHYSTKQGYMDEIVITIAQPAQKKKMNLNIEAYSSWLSIPCPLLLWILMIETDV